MGNGIWLQSASDQYELALHEWGWWPEEIFGPPENSLDLLVDSYMRRQTWLQRNQAVQVLNAYGEAMSGGKTQDGTQPVSAEQARHLPPEALIGDLGGKVKVARKQTKS